MKLGKTYFDFTKYRILLNRTITVSVKVVFREKKHNLTTEMNTLQCIDSAQENITVRKTYFSTQKERSTEDFDPRKVS